MNKFNFVFLIILTLLSCESSNNIVEKINSNQENCFIMINLESDLDKSFGLSIHNVNSNITDQPEEVINFDLNDKVVTTNLIPGEYRFTFCGLGNFGVKVDKQSKVFKIIENDLNYAGKIDIIFNSLAIDLKFNHSISNDDFIEAKKLLLKAYPEINESINYNSNINE